MASPAKRPRLDLQEKHVPKTLERQLFDWKEHYANTFFFGITMKQKISGFPSDESIRCVKWLPEESKVVFIFEDGTERTYGLKVSLTFF